MWAQVGPVDLQPVLDMCILNSLWSALTGNRYSLSDSRLSKLIHHIHTLFQLRDMSGGLLNQMPFLRFLPPERDAYNQLLHIHNEIRNFLRVIIYICWQRIQSNKRNRKQNCIFFSGINWSEGLTYHWS